MAVHAAAQASDPAVAGGRPFPSPAGPVAPGTPKRPPPALGQGRWSQAIQLRVRPLALPLQASRRLGDVWLLELPTREEPFVVTSHPEHVESLLKADPADAPSLTGESPLRPILGPDSVLTSVGERHMRQRRLLLPPFHGQAVARYERMIAEVIEREIDRWPVGEPFALAPRMRAVTLEVIMRAVFGLGGEAGSHTAEQRLRATLARVMRTSTHPLYALVELRNAGRSQARGLLAALVKSIDRRLYEVIRARRASGRVGGDVLSLLLAARDDQGRPLTDRELRDELMALLLAGHETTANSLAWAFERLLRTPAAYERLREQVRGGGPDGDAYVEATVHETMRVRPVVPMIVRMVMRPWRLGEYVVGARTAVVVSIVALHHRPDVYEDPHGFRPERFLERRPGTYTWIPFGGGIRRCLGASLAMAEQRAALSAIARRTDLRAAETGPERARLRNVTMIPHHGVRVLVTGRR